MSEDKISENKMFEGDTEVKWLKMKFEAECPRGNNCPKHFV